MPSLNKDFLNLLKDDYSKYPLFVETGTNKGVTIFNMEKFFQKLYTIELKYEFYNNCKNIYKGNKINFLNGDSLLKLKELVPELKLNSIFFLDAHYMTGNTPTGIKECPLIEEIESINNFFTKKAIIIIDDFRLFEKKSKKNKWGERIDWTDINKQKIISILDKRLSNLYHLPSELHAKDRLIIHINGI